MRAIALTGMFRTIVSTAVALVGGVSLAQPNLALLESSPGDLIGAGGTYFGTNATEVYVSGTPTNLTVFALGFSLEWTSPTNLTAGTYPLSGRVSGYGWTSWGRPEDTLEIRELASNAQGQVERLWITFVHHLSSGAPPFEGEVRCNSAWAPPLPAARILRVPEEYSTIQAALDAADRVALDTVLVGPGSYVESVQVPRKRVHLIGADGPAQTRIIGLGQGPAVAFAGSPLDTVLMGFTVADSSTGIHVGAGAVPTIVSNVVQECSSGLYCSRSTNVFGESLLIRGNRVTGCFTGVYLPDSGEPRIEGNVIESNQMGLSIRFTGTPQVRGNLIRSNQIAAVTLEGHCTPVILQNVMIDNPGGGIVGDVSTGGRGIQIHHNTIAGRTGPAVSLEGYWSLCQVRNNILLGKPALHLGASTGVAAEVVQFNGLHAFDGPIVTGAATNLVGIAGNRSGDPFFACQPNGDLRLLAWSPCIDAGTNDAAWLPPSDWDGGPRLLAGSANGVASVDLGAFEFDPAGPAPVPCRFLVCPTNRVVVAPPGATTAAVTYESPWTTPGASVTTHPPSGSEFPVGVHPVTCTSIYEAEVLECTFTIQVLAAADFDVALGQEVDWVTGGDGPWTVVYGDTHDGVGAAQSGPVGDSGTSWLEAEFMGPGTLRFWWKVDSAENWNFLSLGVAGVEQQRISGDTGWLPVTVYLGSEPQLVRWTFTRKPDITEGQELAWVDQVTYEPGATAPIVTTPPRDQSAGLNRVAVFTVTAIGTPPLSYQWRLNGVDLPGATESALRVTRVNAAQLGSYDVVVSNSAGSTVSAPAVLRLAQVIGWGSDSYGEATAPPDLTNAVQVAGGPGFGIALKSDDTVAVWGSELALAQNVPAGLSNVVAIAAKTGLHVVALQQGGTVVAWGYNGMHQTEVPAELSNVVAIAAGREYSLALKSDGTTVGWGNTVYSRPEQLNAYADLVAIQAGDLHCLALRADGTVVASGDNAVKQGPPPPGVSNVVAIAAGRIHSLALLETGRVVAWGSNLQGQTNVPAGLSNVVAINAGEYSSVALKADGTVVAWGKCRITNPTLAATPPAGLTNVVAIGSGKDHHLAILGNGPPAGRATLEGVRRVGDAVEVSVNSECGRVYRLERTVGLDAPVWVPLPLVAGTGRRLELRDPAPDGQAGFYRVCRW